jgi:hypothetical protein
MQIKKFGYELILKFLKNVLTNIGKHANIITY